MLPMKMEVVFPRDLSLGYSGRLVEVTVKRYRDGKLAFLAGGMLLNGRDYSVAMEAYTRIRREESERDIGHEVESRGHDIRHPDRFVGEEMREDVERIMKRKFGKASLEQMREEVEAIWL